MRSGRDDTQESGKTMADIFVLLQALKTRNAGNDQGTAKNGQVENGDSIEARFRAVLPNLVNNYLTSSQTKERELLAVLKLLNYTTKNFPGVFNHGKGHAVLPIIGRIIALFAEPGLRARGNNLFDTLAALTSLLRNGDGEIYNKTVLATAQLVEDLASVASFFSCSTNFTTSTSVSLQAFSAPFEAISKQSQVMNLEAGAPVTGDEQILGYSTSSYEGFGVHIDVTGNARWQLLAEWMIRLLGRCLNDGGPNLGRILPASFLSTLGFLLSCGNSSLQKACFETIQLATATLDSNLVPSEDLVLSLVAILSVHKDAKELPAFRTAEYDSALGACLTALYTSGGVGLIECTAKEMVHPLPGTVTQTRSRDLKVALCEAFAIILRHCPAYASQVPRLLALLPIPEISSLLSHCIHLIVDTHPLFRAAESPEVLASTMRIQVHTLNSSDQQNAQHLSSRKSKHVGGSSSNVSGVNGGTKRPKEAVLEIEKVDEKGKFKRQKVEPSVVTQKEINRQFKESAASKSVDAMQYTEDSLRKEQHVRSHSGVEGSMQAEERGSQIGDFELYKQVVAAIRHLGPESEGPWQQRPDMALTGLRVMARVFGGLPDTFCWGLIVSHMGTWTNKVNMLFKQGSLAPFILGTFVEAMMKVILPGVNIHQAYGDLDRPSGTTQHSTTSSSWDAVASAEVLLLPWRLSTPGTSGALDSLSRVKGRALRLAPSLAGGPAEGLVQGLLAEALMDPDERVRAAAVRAVPQFAPFIQTPMLIGHMQKLRSLVDDTSETVREAVARSVGLFACLSTSAAQPPKEAAYTVGPFTVLKPQRCTICDGPDSHHEHFTNTAVPEMKASEKRSSETLQPSQVPIDEWYPLVSTLIYSPQSTQVYIAAIQALRRLLRHATLGEIHQKRKDWVRFLEILPVHLSRSVRIAFNSFIPLFLEQDILGGVSNEGGVSSLGSMGRDSLEDGSVLAKLEGSADLAAPLFLLRKLEHHLHSNHDADVQETLLGAVEAVAWAAGKRHQLPYFCLIVLVEQLDNGFVALRAKAVAIIHRFAMHLFPGQPSGQVAMRAVIDRFREEMYEYIGERLLKRPEMVAEFAEAVMGMDSRMLVKEIIPVVLPKLVLGAAAGIGQTASTKQHQSEEALALLQEIAGKQGVELPVLLLEWCHKILAHLLLQANGQELGAVLQFYEAQTSSDSHSIFLAVLPALLGELIPFLGAAESEIARQRSARVVPMLQEVANIVVGSDDLPSFLRTYFVGLLNSIDHNLLRAKDRSAQHQALRCIEKLLDLIGPHLSAFVPKLMALLTRALQEPALRCQGLATWLSLVRILARVSPASLKSVATQIVVAIVPCFDDVLTGVQGAPPRAQDCQGSREKGALDEPLSQGTQKDVLPVMAFVSTSTGQEAPYLAAAVDVLEEIVVQNRVLLAEELHELSFLPNIPALARVNKVLEDANGEVSLRQQLWRAVDRLGHESLSVRYMAAGELKRLLQAKGEAIADMVDGESSLDKHAVSQLVAALLRGCAEESRTLLGQRLKLACAECLGELGAVDPAKLQVELPQRSKIEREDEDLVYELISEHLTKVLRAAVDTDVQDAAALAIQELLKLSGCQPSLVSPATFTHGLSGAAASQLGRSGGGSAAPPATASSGAGKNTTEPGGRSSTASVSKNGESFWARFPDDIKEIIAPCLTSKFSLKHTGASQPPGPIYSSHVSYRRWIHLWCRRLVSQASGTRAHIFSSCRGIMRHDISTALFLLSYLVLNVLCDGSDEARQGVTQEILAVLAQGDLDVAGPAADDTHAGLRRETRVSEAGMDGGGVTGGGQSVGPVAGGGGGALGQASEVSTQTIFSLLDNLARWLDDCKQAKSILKQNLSNRKGADMAVQERMQQVDRKQRHVEELLAAVPKKALARASFRCQAYARALLYYETHVRETSGTLNPAAEQSGSFSESDVSFLLEIYSGLDEPDGLTGFSRLKGATSLQETLQDRMLIHEKEGNWSEALTCYEQALQLEPRSAAKHSGLLNCLLNMGHLQAMATHVDGLLSRMPEHSKEWSARGLQAAWRLGHWDRLEEYAHLSQTADKRYLPSSISAAFNTGLSFDIDLARALKEMHQRNSSALADAMTKARQALLPPLAAASMESYTRAYPLIVKLHMLKELEDSYALHAFGGGESVAHNDLVATKSGNVGDRQANVCSGGEGRSGSTPGNSGFTRSAGEGKSVTAELLRGWESRLKLTQFSLWTQEPILALRRLIYKEAGLQAEVGTCWLQYAKLCRRAGHYETANRAILEARSHGAPDAHIESAKLLWANKKTHRAIAELQEVLQRTSDILGAATEAALAGLHHPVSQPLKAGLKLTFSQTTGPGMTNQGTSRDGAGRLTISKDQAQSGAKTLLLLTQWVHHTGQRQKDQVLAMYNRVRELQPQWEKSFFCLAKYCDDLYLDAKRRQEESNSQESSGEALAVHRLAQRLRLANKDDKMQWWTYQADAMFNYAKALRKGHRHLFQALPRLLTLCFDFGTKFPGDNQQQSKAVQADHKRVIDIMWATAKNLPTYQWLTALPQLVSRICHQSYWVVQLLKVIISGVLRTHPQQALWTMAAVSKSTYPARQAAANDIINLAQSSAKTEEERQLFVQFAHFIEQMIKLCFHQGAQGRGKVMSIATEFGPLKRMMPVPVIIPVQRALTVTLPPEGVGGADYNPFNPGECATVVGIQDEVEVLASLQKPKKVVLLGSDGREYPFLCKPKDDLRKDARMMEFTSMLNRLLSKDANSRRRKLYIRTFAVIPLTEDCGMVEWVLNTKGLRHILQDTYRAAGRFDQKTNGALKRLHDQAISQGMSPGEMLRTKLLPLFPPIFHKWLLNSFPEPAAWFRARLSYAQTTAVWSMVGHIVGLGDRHGENILLDGTTGDCVHVDFSCLFDKGLALEKPEVVPFRLTQNMVDGLGITGYEGVFLRVCEITLSVLRSNRETLMSVLETFIHDPLVEWTTKSQKSTSAEVQNPHAQRALANIEARLQGVVVGVCAAPSLPLSVEGQAHRLIADAISHENLGRMYIWWMPWF